MDLQNLEAETTTGYLQKAIEELNENDGRGIVSKIKMHVKLVMVNNEKIAKLQKSNKDLMTEIQKLTASSGLKASDFVL